MPEETKHETVVLKVDETSNTANVQTGSYTTGYEYVLPWKDVGFIAETFKLNADLQAKYSEATSTIKKYEEEVTGLKTQIEELKKKLEDATKVTETPAPQPVPAPAPAPAVVEPVAAPVIAANTNYDDKDEAESKTVEKPKTIDHSVTNEGTVVLTQLLKRAREQRKI